MYLDQEHESDIRLFNQLVHFSEAPPTYFKTIAGAELLRSASVHLPRMADVLNQYVA